MIFFLNKFEFSKLKKKELKTIFTNKKKGDLKGPPIKIGTTNF